MSMNNPLHPTNTQTGIGADVNFNTIPESMRVLRQWCVWGKRTEVGVDVVNIDKKGESKLDKTPFNPVTGKMAESNNPQTWESFESVLNAYETGLYNGIGFIFNYEVDGLAGIDLDHCFKDGQLSDEAKSIVEQFPGGFIEFSPSGDGVHIYVKGMPMHCGKGKRNKWIECYGRGINGKKSNRYFCVTGHLFGDNAVNGCEIADGQSGLFWVDENYKKVVEEKPNPVYQPRSGASGEGQLEKYVRSAFDSEIELVRNSPVGTRNDQVFKSAASLKDFVNSSWASPFISESEIELALVAATTMEEKRTRRTIQSAFRGRTGTRDKPQSARSVDDEPDLQPPLSPDSASGGDALGGSRQGLIEICLNGTRLQEQHNKALAALQAKNTPPHIFVFDGVLARIEQSHSEKTGETKLGIIPLNVQSLRYELETVTYCYTYNREKDIRSPCPPSRTLCENILAEPSYDRYTGFPEIVRVITAPIVTKAGQIITLPGYDTKSGIYYHSSTPLNLTDIEPTEANVKWAKDLLFDHLLVNFPFTSESDKANAVAYLLVPFCRDMIDGPVPLHLFSAPVQASGKSLLGGLLTRIFNPLQGFSAAPKSLDADDEWRKIITSGLLGQNSHLFFDNVTGKVESANLANILTSTIWQDRLLGGNQNIQLENKLIYAMTANNLTLGDDMVRRTVEIRIDPQCARPEERKDFKHTNIRGWAPKHRASLVSAVLILIRYWLAKGKPQPSPETPSVGSFEHWRYVMGGILDSVGIPGFLQNKEKAAERADGARALWETFFEEWYLRFESSPMKTNDLHALAKELGIFNDVLPSKNERSEIVRLGRQLSTYTDRVFGEVKLVRKQVRKSYSYQLIVIGSELSALPTPHNPTPTPHENTPTPHQPHTDKILNNKDSVGLCGVNGVLGRTHKETCNKTCVDQVAHRGGSIENPSQPHTNAGTPLNTGDSAGVGLQNQTPHTPSTPHVWQDTTKSVYERAKDFYLNFQKGDPDKWDELCNVGYPFSELVEEMNDKCL